MANFSSSNALPSSSSSAFVPSMMEPHAASSMAGDALHMSTQLLGESQGTVRFEKTLTPVNVPNGVPNSRCSLEIPQWFVERHGDKLEEYVILRCATSAQPRAPWVVRISLSAFPRVRMSCGWNKFAAFNGLREGDRVVFCLRALSEFEVFVCPGAPGSPGSSVEGLCEPMQKLLALEDCTVAAAGSLQTATGNSIQHIMDFHLRFPMENARASSSRTSRCPGSNHPERTVSFSGIDTVYVDTPAAASNSVKDEYSQVPNFLVKF